jgi:hypothetical protein
MEKFQLVYRLVEIAFSPDAYPQMPWQGFLDVAL